MSFLDTQDKAEQLGFKVNKDLFVVYNTLEQAHKAYIRRR